MASAHGADDVTASARHRWRDPRRRDCTSSNHLNHRSTNVIVYMVTLVVIRRLCGVSFITMASRNEGLHRRQASGMSMLGRRIWITETCCRVAWQINLKRQQMSPRVWASFVCTAKRVRFRLSCSDRRRVERKSRTRNFHSDSAQKGAASSSSFCLNVMVVTPQDLKPTFCRSSSLTT